MIPGLVHLAPSVVVSSLKEIDCLVSDAVHQSVFLGDTPRPTAGEHILQRFGLSRTFERIPHHCLNEIEDSDRDAALVFDPEPEVLQKLGLKYGDPFRLPTHRASLFRNAVVVSGLSFPAFARRSAESKRLAFRGDRSR